MKQKNNQSDPIKENQILKMTIKIMERYSVLNSSLATKVAISLYENGIYLDKFQEKYYSSKTSFYLDEIVVYLLKKQIIEEKTIDYKKYLSSKTERKLIAYSNEKKKPTEIIKYQQKIRKKTQLPDYKYYYNEKI